jgi:hypothetical protein
MYLHALVLCNMIVTEQHHTTWMEALNHETSNLSNHYIPGTFVWACN